MSGARATGGWRRRMRWGLVLLVVVGLLTAEARAQMPVGGDHALASGQRISLDLKGVDILDVLKLLSQKSGLNFVTGRNVTGRVTIFVNDVDVWDAFELLIGANDLAYERTGAIVTVMLARDYELLYGEKFQARTKSETHLLKYAKVAQVATVLNQLKSAVGRVVSDEATNTLILADVPTRLQEMGGLVRQLDRPTESHVYAFNYAEADKLKDKVQELLSPVGTFAFDTRTNKAVVTDLKDNLRKVDQLVKAFDTPEGEVLIEAKIIKVVLTNSMDLGIDWRKVLAGIDTELRSNFDAISGDVVTGTITGGGIKLVGATGVNSSIIIEALKQITTVETLSNPRLMVSNNQEAKILVGKREAIVTTTTTVPATGSTVSSPEIQFVDVGTKLFVTPQVKSDGHIQIKVRPEVSSAEVKEFNNNRIPIVSSTEAETNVLVKSGTTLIMGGLMETKKNRTDSRIPFLGDLPLLGVPFRGSKDSVEKTELVLFLTPQIVKPDGSFFEPARAAGEAVPVAYRDEVRRLLERSLARELRALSLPAGTVELSFLLDREGWVKPDPTITSPNGDAFIAAAKRALATAAPFPSFPGGTEADEVRFRLTVEYGP